MVGFFHGISYTEILIVAMIGVIVPVVIHAAAALGESGGVSLLWPVCRATTSKIV